MESEIWTIQSAVELGQLLIEAFRGRIDAAKGEPTISDVETLLSSLMTPEQKGKGYLDLDDTLLQNLGVTQKGIDEIERHKMKVRDDVKLDWPKRNSRNGRRLWGPLLHYYVGTTLIPGPGVELGQVEISSGEVKMGNGFRAGIVYGFWFKAEANKDGS